MPTITPLLLTITGANKSYSGIPALVDASLVLQEGEVHALIGENGAGKSTLIKLLAGVVNADSIQIVLRGQSVTISDARTAFALGFRFIHQELAVIPQISVAENIFLSQPYPTHARVLVDWRRLNHKARLVLEQLGVTHIDPRQIMARLSTGDQMLVSIARAFVGDDVIGDASGQTSASVYVMDEPTAALTARESESLFSVIGRLRERGSAVLYVSHRLDEIFKIADRITVMRDGRVVDTCRTASTTHADLIRMMTGRTLQQIYPPREAPHSQDVLLDVRNVRSIAVRDITFQLLAGQIIGIAGLSGSGRTEILRALMGVDRLVGGEVVLDAVTVGRLSPASAWQQGIAFVPEERRSQGLVVSHSVSNNITLPQLRHLSHSGMLLNHQLELETSRRVGESVHLKAKSLTQTVRQLSGGNQQKIVFARALTRPPRVLLLDEPTRGVDVGAKLDIYRLIRQISTQGTSILMVSSDLPELLGMADRILVMRGGQLVDNIPAAGLTEEALLTRCYGEIAHGHAQ